ncbi:MAG TPA: zinc-finger domain-containing protein [Ideonella sp.]|nr:zinc-finger domain-containing protein [Ideonella sp.]
MDDNAPPRAASIVEVVAQDLKGPGVVFCPNPKMTLWSNHPRVFIDIATTGEGKCPYCGTLYRLKAGERLAQSH